jgi:hypothetical protein
MGRKSRLKRERREAKARAPKYDPIEGPGFTIEFDGTSFQRKNSDDPIELAQARADLETRVAKLPEEIDVQIERFRSKIAKYPSMNILAQLTAVMKLHNPETLKEYEIKHPSIELEYVTWLLLQLPSPIIPSDSSPDWIETPDLKGVVDDLSGLVREVLDYHLWASVSAEDSDGLIVKSKIDHILVRNRGYDQHLIELLKALFSPLESELSNVLGFTVDEAIALSIETQEYVISEIRRLGRVNQEYYELLSRSLRTGDTRKLTELGFPKELSKKLLALSKKDREDWAIVYRTLKFWNNIQSAMVIDGTILSNRTDVGYESARSFLEVFSLPFGQESIADNWPSRYEPLYHAPLVRLVQDTYFAHLAMTELLWAIRPNLESQIKGTNLWQKYNKHRADTTESEAVRLLTSILEGCRSYRNLKYAMPDDHGTLRQYELDGLILYDQVLILLEAKAGSVSPAARRGAPSLEEHLKELLGKGKEQTSRAREYLDSGADVVFQPSEGEVVVLSSRDFSRVIEIVVTLDSIAAVVTEWEATNRLQAKANSSYCWSVELLDLRVVVELVEFGPQLIHYIGCLSRFPPGVLDFNDSLDAFGNYLQSGLKIEYEPNEERTKVQLLSHTTDFDYYFRYLAGLRKTPTKKPAMALDAATHSKLKELCDAAAPGFVERACDLLDNWRDTAAQDRHDTFQRGQRRGKRGSRSVHKTRRAKRRRRKV